MNSLEAAVSLKYTFKPYSKSFPKLFTSEKHFLSKLFSSIKEKEIHHIGSTSVPTLGGKGIIDIIVVVPKKSIAKAKKLLKNGEFVYHHTLRRKRSFHYKYYEDARNFPRLVHLHLTYFGSGELEKALAFRDYLRTHPKERKAYEKVKRQASKLHSKNGKKYVKYKLKFVLGLMKKATEWYNSN